MSRKMLIAAVLFALAALAWLNTAPVHANPPPYAGYGYTPGAYDDEGPETVGPGYVPVTGPVQPYSRYGYTPGAYDYSVPQSYTPYDGSFVSTSSRPRVTASLPVVTPDRKVHLTLRLPADARVWFNGTHIPGNGAVRRFESPALSSDADHAYHVRVVWKESSKEVEQIRRVIVHANDDVALSFTTPRRNPATVAQQK